MPDLVTVEELDANSDEAKEALRETGLAIMEAGTPEFEGYQGGFFAAHNNTRSVLYLVHTGQRFVWVITGGPKEERKAVAEHIREKLRAQCGLKYLTEL